MWIKISRHILKSTFHFFNVEIYYSQLCLNTFVNLEIILVRLLIYKVRIIIPTSKGMSGLNEDM